MATYGVSSLFLFFTVIGSLGYVASSVLPLPQDYCTGRHGEQLPHPLNCHAFVTCVGDSSIVRYCAPSLMYNSKLKVCDYRYNVNCTGSPCNNKNGGCQHACIYLNHYSYRCACKGGYQLDYDEKTCKRGSIINMKTYCEGEREHSQIKHPFKCDAFITCVGGRSSVTACPAGLWYNGQVCDWQSNVQCNSADFDTWAAWGSCFTNKLDQDCIRVRRRDCRADGNVQRCGGFTTQAESCADVCAGNKKKPCDWNNGGCSDICTNSGEKAVCSCKDGRQLGVDKKTCVAEKCGIAPLRHDEIVAFIISGMEAAKGSYPWQVAIYYTNAYGEEKFHCGGSLIDKRYVVSAAHCFPARESQDPSKYKLVLGENDRKTAEGGEQTVAVRKITNHREFNQVAGSFRNDISLLELSEDAKFGNFISPICLPSADEELQAGKSCRISGWGNIAHMSAKPDRLQEVTVPVVNHDKCVKRNERTRHVYPDMLCTGFNDGSTFKSACHGDSGGPLSCLSKGVWKLYGVVSWGSSQCNALDIYNVFTKVSKYISWIDENKS